MNLVGFGLTAHDSSIAAYKDGKFLYRKAERQFNCKHAHAGMDWALSVLKEWDIQEYESCLLYTSPSPRDLMRSRMPSSA